MTNEPKCPQCRSEHVYLDDVVWICPECSYEWSVQESNATSENEASEQGVRDAHGNTLQTGDSVIVIKDLKVKGSSSAVKAGTKVKNIRLVDGDDGHDIGCNIDGFGAMYLKSEFVKKA